MPRPRTGIIVAATAVLLAACNVTPARDFPREQQIDLERFMGRWFVIAHIVPFATDNGYNIVERYEQTKPGVIATTLTYRDGSFDGELKKGTPTGFVVDGTGNAVWGMQFLWPFEAQYVISHVDDGYNTTIVAREDRDYVWIMAREPGIPESQYRSLVTRVERLGYDTDELRRVPQQPMNKRGPLSK